MKHDGYRLQVHVRDGRVRLYTMNGADWSKRYPRIVEEAARIKGHAIIDAEVVCLDSKGVAQFDLLHNRSNDGAALALGFDLLALNGNDLRKHPLVERKTALSKLLIRSKGGIQYVEHADGHGERMFAAVCRLGLEGIVSKRSSAAYRSGPTRTWIKVKNPPRLLQPAHRMVRYDLAPVACHLWSCVMRNQTPSAPGEPDFYFTVYVVLNDFGYLGRAYVETDETEADEAAIVENILKGEYSHPLRVVAFNTAEGWARDVTEDIARAALSKAQSEHRSIARFTQEFLERTLGVDVPVSD